MGQDGKVKLKKIKIGGTCQSGEISYRKRYRVKIDGEWYEGMFSKQWFGWCFDNYGQSGKQLNLIDEAYEIVPIKNLPKKGRDYKKEEGEVNIHPEDEDHGS